MDVVGTFEACIENEKYGGKHTISNMQNNIKITETDFHNAANDIGLPIYVFNFNNDMKWRLFQPAEQHRKQCRYYVTLVRHQQIWNKQERVAFNRVTPDHDKTCNCSMVTPLVGKYWNRLHCTGLSIFT